MTTTHDGTGPIIPDFEKDAQSLAAYNEARVRYERREASDAESRTRSSFTKKRDAIRAEIAAAASILGERRITAEKAFKTYANRYPQRVDRNKPLKPSLLESLLSLGSAGRMFNRAVTTAADAVAAQTLRRRKEHDEEELEQQLKRTLYLQEDAIKKKLEGPEGIQAFHARPGVGDMFKRVEEIKAERAHYAQRLEKGDVPPAERRDREFAERKISQLEVPFAGMTIVRVARYGDLSYYLLRDLERKVYRLAYDPRLEPLIEHVVDVYRLADSFETKLSRGTDGRPLAVADHYAANFKDEEVARSEYRRSRTALRAPRTDIPPMTSLEPAEAQLVELLATFARTIAPSAMAHVPTNVPPARDVADKPAAPPPD
ncbi:MAG TPA: hypothetical protein VIJ64_05760 [Candidatus Lustribacter sp.]